MTRRMSSGVFTLPGTALLASGLFCLGRLFVK